MKLNEFTTICGEKVILIPYRKEHVPKYHEWMKSEELLMLTASEPLTVNQEYEMQKSWREDDDKCTFIILDKTQYDVTGDEITAMVGDTNIFVKDKDKTLAEIEIMIAEPSARGKGMGKEAVLMMLRYGAEYLQLKTFQAKISMDNETSIQLFTKIGFTKAEESNIFKEVTLQQETSEEWMEFLKQETKFSVINSLNDNNLSGCT